MKIPGYGESTHSATPSNTAAYSKRAIGNIILEALKKLLKTPERKIILLGHDRGARIIHRLAVDAAEGFLQEKYGFDLLGVALLDIVPTIVQFASFADPAVAAATFHWYLLTSYWYLLFKIRKSLTPLETQVIPSSPFTVAREYDRGARR